jgi:hypothetical protein
VLYYCSPRRYLVQSLIELPQIWQAPAALTVASKRTLHMYESLDDVPHSILQTVATADSAAAAADMAAMLAADRQG